MNSPCDTCALFPCVKDEKDMPKVKRYCPWHHRKPMPMTNGDKIRSMSDYDLADWIAEILTYHGAFSSYQDWDFERKCIGCPLEKCCNDQPTDNIEGWLKLPADKEETE